MIPNVTPYGLDFQNSFLVDYDFSQENYHSKLINLGIEFVLGVDI